MWWFGGRGGQLGSILLWHIKEWNPLVVLSPISLVLMLLWCAAMELEREASYLNKGLNRFQGSLSSSRLSTCP
jgi:hypothetical protein